MNPAHRKGRLVYEGPRKKDNIETAVHAGKVRARIGQTKHAVHIEEADTELAALTQLLDSGRLDADQTAAVQKTIAGLLEPRGKTREDWDYKDIGTRGKAPRAKRLDWKNPITGKRMRVYADTLRPHRNPDCPCVFCSAGRRQMPG